MASDNEDETANDAAESVSLKLAFRKYDADSSGAINVDELGSLCAELGFELSESALEQALRELDTNGDGTVGFDEFTAWWDGLGQQSNNESADEGVTGQLRAIAKRGRAENHVDIHSACYHGSADTVQEFLAMDASLASLLDSTEFGESNTPLHYAAYCGSPQVCQVLLSAGKRVNVNARNDAGCTALFIASQQGHADVVAMLLKNGARINIGDKKHGLSPIEVSENQEVTALLTSECDVSVPKRPSAAPQTTCPTPGRLRVSWNYRGAEQSASRSLPVSSFTVQVLRSNEAPDSDLDDSDNEEPLSPNPATRSEDSKFGTVLKEVVVNGGDTSSVQVKAEFPFPLQARVAACNKSGQSEWSERSASVLCASAPVVNKPPVAEPLSRTSIQVSWSLPSKNGAALQAFKLEANDGKGDWESMGVFPATVRSTQVESLRPGQAYSFRIICSNAVGKSKPGPACAPIRTK